MITKKIIRQTIKLIRDIIIKIKFYIKKKISKKIYVSFGENCLADNILKRYKLNTMTTVFSHGRSNAEYILQLEYDNYKDFTNIDYLKYEDFNGKDVPRLKKYNIIQNSYNHLHENGFEFTHHDVISSDAIRLKMTERVHKIQNLIGKKRFIIMYHHRVNKKTNINLLLEDLDKIKQIYSKYNTKSEVVLFTQKIVKALEERKLSYTKENGIHYFTFHTLNEWTGDDDQILWAKCDDDLIKDMIRLIKRI